MCNPQLDTFLRVAISNPQDYTARSNLMWDAAMAKRRIIKLGKRTDFACQQMEYQIEAYMNCGHGAGLSVLHPVYYRYVYRDGIEKFKRFAMNAWGISAEGKSSEDISSFFIYRLGSEIFHSGQKLKT